MSKQRALNTLEWTHSTQLQGVETTAQAQTHALRAFFDEGGSRLPQDGGHDHAVNDMVFDPPQASAVSLTIPGQVSTPPPYFDDSDAASSSSRFPVHTSEWTHPREGTPGRTSEESVVEEKVSLLFDDEDFDLSGLDDFANSSVKKDGEQNGATLGYQGDHGILIDFEDDALEIDEILKQAVEPETDTDDDGTNTDKTATPTEPEPPVPHAMAQFILIVGMADAPSEDPGLDDAGVAAAVV